jgi:DNA-binding NarL/FixJ family response regulator
VSPPSSPIRVVVVDDHPIVLEGLERLFHLEGDIEVVARCVNAGEALESLRTHRPDLLILDVRLPGRDGLDVLEAMRREGIPTRVVLLTGMISEAELLQALQLGVRGVVLKEVAPEVLVRCVRKVHAGDRWLDNDFLARTLEGVLSREGMGRGSRSALSSRELEVVRLAASGLHNRQIADDLTITEGTVKVHLHNIYEKLGLEGRVELTLYARDRGWV